MPYDRNNIFAKILRGDIPCQKIFENDHVLVFKDIHPKAKHHLLLIPKGAYVDAYDFMSRASDQEVIAMNRAVAEVVKMLGLPEAGFRLISNAGHDGGQEVPHYHIHLLGGERLKGF
jgi:diadenosine tetraphosphate (Ap4A) HIT family hydrolase